MLRWQSSKKSQQSNIFSTWSALSVAAAIIVSILAVSYGARKWRQETQQTTTMLPQVVSKVRNLEIVNSTIQKPGLPGAAAAIEIRNNSDKAVIAITLESGNDTDAYGINRNGFNGDSKPATVIEPHSTVVMEMEFANLLPDSPIKVAGVIYADGTEDGDIATLGTMHRQRDRERAKASMIGGGKGQ